MKYFLGQLSSFIAPVVMTVVLPYLLLRRERKATAIPPMASSPLALIVGLVFGLAGLAGFIITARMFILIGRGTIMPWDPTRNLIVAGIYRHVRNPMILSVLLIEIGIAILFASPGVALLAGLFFVINTVYFIFSEEPGLEKRFGEEYVEYKQNVPRWLPRLKPWKPG